MTRLLFIPLDDRPATCDAVLDLARAVGVDVTAPPQALRGGRDVAADRAALWEWIETETARTSPDACIASCEMLCFGGLVASRRGKESWQGVLPWLDRIHALAGRTPLYLSGIIPRTPVGPAGDEDAEYWNRHGEEARAEELWHRRRHLLINAELLAAAARGRLRALLIGQDDAAPDGLSPLDRIALERLAHALQAAPSIVTTGADELGARLFARWLNDTARASPRVRVALTFPEAAARLPAYESAPLAQTVEEHLAGAGCVMVERNEEILLWVHNFDDPRQREARDQPEAGAGDDRAISVADALGEMRDRVVAVADVRYANGADAALVGALLEHPGFAGVDAYAGWNTSSNALGSALAQAVAVYHVRRGTVRGDTAEARRVVISRLLDDWGYQAAVRERLRGLVQRRHGDPGRLDALAREMEETALGIFQSEIVPRIEASFGGRIALRRVRFPWNRLFEAAFDFDLAASPKA